MIVAAIFPLPLAYRGLGELFVILFFGLIAVTGTVFVLIGEWRAEALLLGFQIGLLSTALIAINNLRDIDEDSTSGKRTLAVRCGKAFGRREIAALCFVPLVLGVLWKSPLGLLWPALLPLGVVPVSLVIVRGVFQNEPGACYNRFLGLAALQMLLFAALFTIGIIFS